MTHRKQEHERVSEDLPWAVAADAASDTAPVRLVRLPDQPIHRGVPMQRVTSSRHRPPIHEQVLHSSRWTVVRVEGGEWSVVPPKHVLLKYSGTEPIMFSGTFHAAVKAAHHLASLYAGIETGKSLWERFTGQCVEGDAGKDAGVSR